MDTLDTEAKPTVYDFRVLKCFLLCCSVPTLSTRTRCKLDWLFGTAVGRFVVDLSNCCVYNKSTTNRGSGVWVIVCAAGYMKRSGARISMFVRLSVP